MSKRAFYFYVGFLVALLLLSVSPFAVLGGMMVVAPLIILVGAVVVGLGGDVRGDKIDLWISAVFFSVSFTLAMFALWLFYRAGNLSDHGEIERARGLCAVALSLLTAPVVIYFFYRALPI